MDNQPSVVHTCGPVGSDIGTTSVLIHEPENLLKFQKALTSQGRYVAIEEPYSATREAFFKTRIELFKTASLITKSFSKPHSNNEST